MYQECSHIMPSGAKCHSPALRGKAYCYFHVPGRRNAQGQRRPRNKPLQIPALVDRGAIQTALSQVLNAIGSSKISTKAAGQLLFGLRIASDLANEHKQLAPAWLAPTSGNSSSVRTIREPSKAV